MRLAAAEVGLELDDRVAAAIGEALDAANEESAQAFGEEGASEELGRVAVLVGAFAKVHLPEVGGELSLLVTTAGDVGMGRHHLAPGTKRLSGCRRYE